MDLLPSEAQLIIDILTEKYESFELSQMDQDRLSNAIEKLRSEMFDPVID